jgi:hypothetical protein
MSSWCNMENFPLATFLWGSFYIYIYIYIYIYVYLFIYKSRSVCFVHSPAFLMVFQCSSCEMQTNFFYFTVQMSVGIQIPRSKMERRSFSRQAKEPWLLINDLYRMSPFKYRFSISTLFHFCLHCRLWVLNSEQRKRRETNMFLIQGRNYKRQTGRTCKR